MTLEYISISDAVSRMAERDTCFVLPTLKHALWWWERVNWCIRERHGAEWVTTTKTATVSKRTKTTMRLWVPYTPNPTMPLDTERHRRKFDFVTPYSKGIIP